MKNQKICQWRIGKPKSVKPENGILRIIYILTRWSDRLSAPVFTALSISEHELLFCLSLKLQYLYLNFPPTQTHSIANWICNSYYFLLDLPIYLIKWGHISTQKFTSLFLSIWLYQLSHAIRTSIKKQTLVTVQGNY